MRHLAFFVMTLALLAGCASTSHYQAPFISDGCSAWPDGDWLDCCVAHDVAYWRGGPEPLRQEADMALRQCVADTGYPTMGDIMYLGVRIGGERFYPTPYRWGYGQISD